MRQIEEVVANMKKMLAQIQEDHRWMRERLGIVGPENKQTQKISKKRPGFMRVVKGGREE